MEYYTIKDIEKMLPEGGIITEVYQENDYVVVQTANAHHTGIRIKFKNY